MFHEKKDVVKRDKRIVYLTIGAVGVVLWPLVLSVVCRSKNVSCIKGSLWMVSMWLFDSNVMRVVKHPETRGVDFDRHALTGLAFSLSGRRDCEQSDETKHLDRLLTYAVVACFLAVTPSHELPKDSMSAWVVDSIQNVMLRWCVALVVTAM